MTQSAAAGNSDDRSIEVWNRVLGSALALPGARISRATYLRKELPKHFPEDVVQQAIDTTPAKAGIPSSKIRSIAQSSINWHRGCVTAVSAVAGLPGGWWMAGTIPADLTQFFWHVAVVLQKLAYLHGWPELIEEGDELDDETLLIFTIFVGVMFGASSATKALATLAERVSTQVVKRLPQQALTKWGVYNLAKQIAKWIGVRLTKQGFAQAMGKMVPIVGGVAAGLISWFWFSAMSKRLREHLETLRPHTDSA